MRVELKDWWLRFHRWRVTADNAQCVFPCVCAHAGDACVANMCAADGGDRVRTRWEMWWNTEFERQIRVHSPQYGNVCLWSCTAAEPVKSSPTLAPLSPTFLLLYGQLSVCSVLVHYHVRGVWNVSGQLQCSGCTERNVRHSNCDCI